MTLRVKIPAVFATAIVSAVALMAWVATRNIQAEFDRLENQRSDVLLAQIRHEFTQREAEVVDGVQQIAEAEGTLRMAMDLSRAQADPSTYANDARGIAASHQLDFLDLVGDDGVLISSAQWPGRIGFKNDWVALQKDWNRQGAFLGREELPDNVELGLLAVRVVRVADKNLYIVGGQRLDRDFLQSIVVPAGMRILLYRNLETAFVPAALSDAAGQVNQPERFSAIIGSAQRNAIASKYSIQWTADEDSTERFTTLPLLGRSNELLGLVLVGSTQAGPIALLAGIRMTALLIGAACILFCFPLSWSISKNLNRPLDRLAGAAREIAAGNWDLQPDLPSTGEIGAAAGAFSDMAGRLTKERDRLLQSERVNAWREMARRVTNELKLPVSAVQARVERLGRAGQPNKTWLIPVTLESISALRSEIDAVKDVVGRFTEFANTTMPRLQPSNVNDVVRSAVKAFEPKFSAVGRPPITPELHLEAETLPVQADPELLYQALEKLVLNVVAGMPTGGVLTIRTSHKNGFARIEISDAEPVDVSELERAPAAQFTAKLNGTGLGLGLDLAMVQSVVSDHKGRIAIESTPGAGTTFRVDLPLSADAVLTVPSPSLTPVRLPEASSTRVNSPVASTSQPQQSAQAAIKPNEVNANTEKSSVAVDLKPAQQSVSDRKDSSAGDQKAPERQPEQRPDQPSETRSNPKDLPLTYV